MMAEDFEKLIEIDVDDQILDVECVQTVKGEHAILSPLSTPNTLSSSLSQTGDELDPLQEFLESESGCLQFGDGLTDDESLDLCGYLSGASLPLHFDDKKPQSCPTHNRVVNDIELLKLKQRESMTGKETCKVRDMHKLSENSNQQCMSKNAVAARENRLKKKQYISQLETAVKDLREENESLRKSEIEKDDELCKLKKEVQYLSNILENETTLSSLLQNIHRTPGVHFTDRSKVRCQGLAGNQNECAEDESHLTFSKNDAPCMKRKIDADGTRSVCRSKRITRSNSSLGAWKEGENNDSGGICLHVTGKKVSIEFCADCNNNSKSSLIFSDHSYVQQKMS